ncbi:uncharacterized protein LOC113305555 [Papaver somniferum]|uniref:uncharacterized protein LOC113305555 n=1 Tax=Papaver somniferum TaxID=3469 RepID=UPI000E7012C2|nr:uncharacterized protein LOC113305555 [Papaver somniferum]
MGDFNIVLSNEEKKGLRPFYRNEDEIFKDILSDMGVQDMGFTGYPYTWCNQITDNTRVEERLDRAFCNDEWIAFFPQSNLYQLVARGSDHNPIILKTSPNWKDGAYPFKYFGGWMEHPDCKRIIMEAWNSNQFGSASYSLAKNMSTVKNVLKRWNKTVFGNIKHRIYELKKNIEKLSQNTNRCHIAIKKLEESLQQWKDIEEDYWKTKSRNNRINLGDRNTSYFHNSARTRYRIN